MAAPAAMDPPASTGRASGVRAARHGRAVCACPVAKRDCAAVPTASVRPRASAPAAAAAPTAPAAAPAASLAARAPAPTPRPTTTTVEPVAASARHLPPARTANASARPAPRPAVPVSSRVTAARRSVAATRQPSAASRLRRAMSTRRMSAASRGALPGVRRTPTAVSMRRGATTLRAAGAYAAPITTTNAAMGRAAPGAAVVTDVAPRTRAAALSEPCRSAAPGLVVPRAAAVTAQRRSAVRQELNTAAATSAARRVKAA